MKQINEVKDIFNVPGIIGQYDSNIEEGLKQCLYPDFKSFVEHSYQANIDMVAQAAVISENLSQIGQRLELAEVDLEKKMYESDFEKAEKKLINKFDEKLYEIKEA